MVEGGAIHDGFFTRQGESGGFWFDWLIREKWQYIRTKIYAICSLEISSSRVVVTRLAQHWKGK